MPPPTNIDALTAFDLGALPASPTPQDVRDAGTNYTVWYKITIPPGVNELGLFGFGALSPGYQPLVAVFDGPASAPTPYTALANITALNVPIQVPVTPGNTYFFSFTSFTGNGPTPAILTITALAAPRNNSVIGDLFINDDTISLPAIILNGTTGAERLFINPFPAGEAGDILPSGIVLVEDDAVAGRIALYSSTLVFISNPAFTFTSGTIGIRTCIGANKFYVGLTGGGATHAQVQSVDGLGNVGPVIGPFASAGLIGFAVKNDETIVYFVQTVGGAVQTWNIGTNSAGADLVAGLASYTVPDILYLSNNTLIVLYFNGTTKDVVAKNFNTAGTLLQTYSFGAAHGATPPRLAYAIDEPNSFWLWTHPSGGSAGKSTFRNIKVSDGSILTTFTVREFEGAAYNGVATATPDASFGNSFSCPFFILRAAVPSGLVNMGSGIYKIVPGKRNDTLYIDPTIPTTQVVKIP